MNSRLFVPPTPLFQLLRFAENASAGLVMAHSLERVGALVLRRDAHGAEELFTSVCSSPNGRRKVPNSPVNNLMLLNSCMKLL